MKAREQLTKEELLALMRVLLDCRTRNLEQKGVHTPECAAAQKQLKVRFP